MFEKLFGKYLVIGALLTSSVGLFAEGISNPSPESAYTALQAGRANDALDILNRILQREPNHAYAHNLMCRVYLTEERWDEAVNHCEQAVRADGGNSDFHMWLGRAYGEKADRVSFLSGYGLGKKVKAEFEAAVRANPRNGAALADLGQFYAEAPSIVGGGTNKAYAIADRLAAFDTIRFHDLRARIADQQKDYGKAEAEFKAALAASSKPSQQWVVLASFYRRRGRTADMLAAIHAAVSADREHGVPMADGADVLTRSNQDLALAAKMMEMYLAANHKTEEAPAFVVHVRLGRVKNQLGDKAGAAREFQTAMTLARDYKPAQQTTNTGR